MTAVIDGAARLRWIVYRAQILPFACPHLVAGQAGAWRVIGEQSIDDVVDLLTEEAAEFVEPERLVDAIGRLSELYCGLSVYGCCGRGILSVNGGSVESFEVF